MEGRMLFLMLTMMLSGSLQSNVSLRSQHQIVERSDIDILDEQLLREVSSVGVALYQNLINILALYYGGFVSSHDQLYDKSFIEIGKHLVQVLKLVASYTPKMLSSNSLSWKIKVQRSTCIGAYIVVLCVWTKEMVAKRQYGAKRNVDLGSNDVAALSDRDSVQHRQRPGHYDSA